ncbi:27710_t:CDS:2, partial [Racocetra persica]
MLMDYEISSCTENDAAFAILSVEYMTDKLPVLENVNNKAGIYESCDSKNKADTLTVNKNIEVSKGDDSENNRDALSVIENIENVVSKYDSSKDEPNNSSEDKLVRVKKENNICTRKTYKCRHGDKYQPKKNLDSTKNRERESACINCGFMLNTAYQKYENRVFVNKFVENYNHILLNSESYQQFLPSSRKRILRNKYPNQEIYSKDLYKMIHKFKVDAQVKNDATTLYEHLSKLQQENPDCSALHISYSAKFVISDFDHHWMELMNKYPEVQEYCDRVLYSTKECWAHVFTKRCFSANTHSTQRVESINWVIKLEANSENSLCQLQIKIELWLKDEAKYASFQKFRNMNPTTGLSHVSDKIFKSVDNTYKNKLNSTNQKQNYDIGFIEEDYEKPQILLDMALEDCTGGKGLTSFDESQESFVQVIQNDNKLVLTRTFQALEKIHGHEINNRDAVKLDSKKVSYSCGLGLCKKALDIAITNGSNGALEGLLQRFINDQIVSMQSTELSEQKNINSSTISNPLQHK